MDREISKEEIRRRRIRQGLMGGAAIAVAVSAVCVISMCSTGSVKESALVFSVADRGDIATGTTAAGTVTAAYEQAVTAPITTTVREIYHHAGDVVDAGTSLMALDLEGARTEHASKQDGLKMKQLELQRMRAENETSLNALEMQIKVDRMKLDRQAVELRNERHLDSIGSSTADRVRELELAYNSGVLELKQLQTRLENERRSLRAAEDIKKLEIEVTAKDLGRTAKSLDEARITSPRRATVTWIVNEVGAQVSAGQKVATIADLGHYRVEASVVESQAAALSPGQPVMVVVTRDTLDGMVSNVSPTAVDGMVKFTVSLDNDSAKVLRPGLRSNLSVSHGLVQDAVRIANGSFYEKPGTYKLWVLGADGNTLECREVVLGQASMKYVEVIHGIAPGERVVLNDMKQYSGRKTLKVK